MALCHSQAAASRAQSFATGSVAGTAATCRKLSYIQSCMHTRIRFCVYNYIRYIYIYIAVGLLSTGFGVYCTLLIEGLGRDKGTVSYIIPTLIFGLAEARVIGFRVCVIHTYAIHTCMHACIHTHIHTYMHACMHACMHTYVVCIVYYEQLRTHTHT